MNRKRGKEGWSGFMDPTFPFQEYFNFSRLDMHGREQEGGVDLAQIRIQEPFGAMVLA